MLFLSWARAEGGYSKESLVKYKDCMNSWVVRHFGGLELSCFDRMSVVSLRSAMVEANTGINRQYSVLMTLKGFLKFCRTVLKVEALNPAEILLPKRPRPHVQYLTNEEVSQIYTAIPPTTFINLRLRALIDVLLTTGLRVSEALSLERLPFETGQQEVEVVGKGGKPRPVFFSEKCIDVVRRYLNRRDDNHPALFVTTGEARRLSRGDLSKTFVALREKSGIDKKLTPHLLRHTFCTNLLHNGADITFIKELAGHQDIQTTARYYLGVDKVALKKVLNRCLDYRTASERNEELSPAQPHAVHA